MLQPAISPYHAFSFLPLFAGIDAALVKKFSDQARVTYHEKGETLLAAGHNALRCSFIIDGWVCARKGNEEGQESVLHILGQGDFFPEIGGRARHPAANDFVALTPVTLLGLPMDVIDQSLQTMPAFAINVMTALNQRAEELRAHIEHLTLQHADHRVGWFLLKLRLQTEMGQEIILPFEKSVIASYLGITPETLSRILAQLQKQGFKNTRNSVVMPHEHALCGYCDTTTAQACIHADTADCPYPPSDLIDPV